MLKNFYFFKGCGSNLIISDIKMPKMNGIEFASNIRRIDKEVTIMLMTAFDVIESPSLEFLNIHDVISKPVKLKHLLEKVNSVKNKVIVKPQFKN